MQDYICWNFLAPFIESCHLSRTLGSKCKRKGQCHDGVCQENRRVAPSGGGWLLLAAGMPHCHTYLLEVTLGPRLQLMNTHTATRGQQLASPPQGRISRRWRARARTACTERGRLLLKIYQHTMGTWSLHLEFGR